MKKSYHISDTILWIVFLLLIASTGYYLYSHRPCAQPIYYTVGTFDTQFGISQTAFLADAQQAANLWNQAAGHTVLAYSATGTMPINLLYDTRQQDTTIGETITQQESALAAQKQQIAQMQSQYDAGKQKYLADQNSGASASTLNAEADSLNAMADQLQGMVSTLNAQIAQVNANANSYNAVAAGVNFEEGEYVEQYGKSYINLYEYKDNTQLVRLMAHELGHSLGLAHNTNPQSIMYPENTGNSISLSTNDKAELNARCALTIQNLNPFQNVSLSSP
jgi:predicted Zn-dependent protease